MNLRPETAALLDAAYRCIALFYGITRYAGRAGVGWDQCVINNELLTRCQSSLSMALEPFGREALDAAILKSNEVQRHLEHHDTLDRGGVG